ncbi:hypothetical protein B0H34DRAFT_247837 [Crassisporium funariophilum]|nr:hypothetical protein B0H34DRAFT_247837 [Crassisporium funariophilum]
MADTNAVPTHYPRPSTMASEPGTGTNTNRVKPLTPPPAYAVLPPNNPSSSSSSSSSHHHHHPSHLTPPYPAPLPYAQPYPYPHPNFGPTPLSSAQPLLPYAYYDAPGAAVARARRRFVRAVMCAIGVWVFGAFVIGLEVFSFE